MACESEEEYFDDLIKLFDLGTDNKVTDGDGIWKLIKPCEECDECDQSEGDETEAINEQDYVRRPSIIKNSSVKLVDCMKFPWYFKKYQQNLEEIETDSPFDDSSDSEIEISSDSDCFIVVDDDIEYVTTLPNTEPLNITKLPTKRPLSQATYDKLRKRLNEKKEIEKQKALKFKNVSQIDFKRNTGLIGLTIKQRIVKNINIVQDENKIAGYRKDSKKKETMENVNLEVEEAVNKDTNILFKIDSRTEKTTVITDDPKYTPLKPLDNINKVEKIHNPIIDGPVFISPQNDTSVKIRLDATIFSKNNNLVPTSTNTTSSIPVANKIEVRENTENRNHLQMSTLVSRSDPCIKTDKYFKLHEDGQDDTRNDKTVNISMPPNKIKKINDIKSHNDEKTKSIKNPKKIQTEEHDHMNRNKIKILSPILPRGISVSSNNGYSKIEKGKNEIKSTSTAKSIVTSDANCFENALNTKENAMRNNCQKNNIIAKESSGTQVNTNINPVDKNVENTIRRQSITVSSNKQTVLDYHTTSDKTDCMTPPVRKSQVIVCKQTKNNIRICSPKTTNSSTSIVNSNSNTVTSQNLTSQPSFISGLQVPYKKHNLNAVAKNINSNLNIIRKQSQQATYQTLYSRSQLNVNSTGIMPNGDSSRRNNHKEALILRPSTEKNCLTVPLYEQKQKYTHDTPNRIIPTIETVNGAIKYTENNNFNQYNNGQQHPVSIRQHLLPIRREHRAFQPLVPTNYKLQKTSVPLSQTPNQTYCQNHHRKPYGTSKIFSGAANYATTYQPSYASTNISQQSLGSFVPIGSAPLQRNIPQTMNTVDNFKNLNFSRPAPIHDVNHTNQSRGSSKPQTDKLNKQILSTATKKNNQIDTKMNDLEPLTTKTEMMEELNKLSFIDNDSDIMLKDSRATPPIIPEKSQINNSINYSPPILPIPTYVKLLSNPETELKSFTTKQMIVHRNENPKRDPPKERKCVAVNNNRYAFYHNKDKEVTTCKKDDAKKISLEEYKRRFKESTANDKRKLHDSQDRHRAKLKKNDKQSSSGETDLGYDSDSTVII